MATPLTDAINALTTYANETTGASDTTLSDAVESLVAGYGGGGGISLEDVLNCTISGDIVFSATRVTDYLFKDCNALESAVVNSLTTCGIGLFTGCANLKSVSMPALTTITGQNTFFNCKKLETVDLPALHTAQIHGTFYFTKVKKVVFGKYGAITNLKGPINLTYTAFNQSTCEIIDCSSKVTVTGGFAGSSTTTAIFRSTEISTLNNVNNIPTTFTTIYCPASLVSDYQTAVNWSTLYNNGRLTFLPIEGSIYETQYADGTPIT